MAHHKRHKMRQRCVNDLVSLHHKGHGPNGALQERRVTSPRYVSLQDHVAEFEDHQFDEFVVWYD